MKSIPRLDETVAERLDPIPGQPPNPARLPSGCPFRVRCRWAEARCAEERPPLRTVSADGEPVHRIACHVDITQVAPHAVEEPA